MMRSCGVLKVTISWLPEPQPVRAVYCLVDCWERAVAVGRRSNIIQLFSLEPEMSVQSTNVQGEQWNRHRGCRQLSHTSRRKQKTVRTAVESKASLVPLQCSIGQCRERLCEMISRSFESHEVESVAGTDEKQITHWLRGSHPRKASHNVRYRRDLCRGKRYQRHQVVPR